MNLRRIVKTVTLGCVNMLKVLRANHNFQGVCGHQLSGKKAKSVFDFFTYSRETWFSFSYLEVLNLHWLIGASYEIDRVTKFDNSLSFGAKQNALQQILFELWIFQSFFTKNSNKSFFNLLQCYVGSIKKYIDVCLSLQIQKNMFLSVAAHRWGCFWVL